MFGRRYQVCLLVRDGDLQSEGLYVFGSVCYLSDGTKKYNTYVV